MAKKPPVYDLDDDDVPAPTDKQIKTISTLMLEQMKLEDRIITGQQLLKDLSAELDEISTKTLPSALAVAGSAGFTTKKGAKVKVTREYYPSIGPKNQVECFAWLRKHNHASLIKRLVSVEFGRGEDRTADAWSKAAAKRYPKHKRVDKQAVHAGTLKAFAKEQIKAHEEGGPAFPKKLFQIYEIDRAKITRPE